MIETIPLKKLTKSYINNHDVFCGGVHCRYVERMVVHTGRTIKQYEVYKDQDIRYPIYAFARLSELKAFIVGK